MTYGGHALAYAILPAEYSTKFSSCSGTFRFKRPNDTSDASRGCVAPSTTSSELSLSAARNRSGNQQRGAVRVESIAPSRLIGRNRPDADIEMTRRKAFPAILRLRDRSYRKPIEYVQWKALRALRTAAARPQSYSQPGHISRQSDRRIHSFVWRQSLLPLVLSGRAKHPDRPRCS